MKETENFRAETTRLSPESMERKLADQETGIPSVETQQLGTKDKFLQLLSHVQMLRAYASNDNDSGDVPNFGLSDEATAQLGTLRGRKILRTWVSTFSGSTRLCEAFAATFKTPSSLGREILRIETRSHIMTVTKPEKTTLLYSEVNDPNIDTMLASVTRMLDALAQGLKGSTHQVGPETFSLLE